MYSILIVDRKTVFREVFAKALANMFSNVSVTVTDSEPGAFEHIRMNVPDILFVNIRLPDGNGLLLTKKIKTEYPQIRCAVMSLYDFPEYVDAAVENKIDYFICHAAMDSEGIVAFIESSLSKLNVSGARLRKC